MLPGGLSAFSQLPDDVVAARLKAAEESSGGVSLPPPPPSAFGLTKEEDQRQIAGRLTPHPLGTYTSPLKLDHPLGQRRAAQLHRLHPSRCIRRWRKIDAPGCSEQGWPMLELATGHDAMVSAPAELTAMLVGLAK